MAGTLAAGASVSPVATRPSSLPTVGGIEVNVLGDRNPRGIPSMVFISCKNDSICAVLHASYPEFCNIISIRSLCASGVALQEDVGDFILAASTKVETLLASLQTMHSKYRMMESHLVVNIAEINGKVPEIEKSLAVIKTLREKQDAGETLATHFNLADNVFARATVTPCDRVCLWLGANVMLEYDYDEAEKLLSENLAGARRKLCDFQEDLDFVRAACITTEVNMARVFNFDVKQRREEKAKLEA